MRKVIRGLRDGRINKRLTWRMGVRSGRFEGCLYFWFVPIVNILLFHTITTTIRFPINIIYIYIS